MDTKKGFTLIELLVVIALMSIMAGVILTATSASRSRGKDTAVKTNLTTVRTSMDVYYINNGNSYIKPGGFGTELNPPQACPTTKNTDMALTSDPTFSALRVAVDKGNQSASLTPRCYFTANSWSVVVALNTDPTKSWCVDSKPSGKLEPFTPANSLDPVTYLCK